MRVLVACEFSGVVRDSFLARGHDAVSCDLLPTEAAGPHIQGDVLAVLGQGWDLMIAFPPCTHLAVSGARWFPEKRKDGRQQEGIDFFMKLAQADIPKIALENPVGIMSTVWRQPDQIIQPWMFGEDVSKKTCLWLKGLPKLKTTEPVEGLFCCGLEIDDKYGCPNCNGDNKAVRRLKKGEQVKFSSGKSMPKWYADAWKLPAEERAKIRSKTFKGIAEAMAEQWGT